MQLYSCKKREKLKTIKVIIICEKGNQTLYSWYCARVFTAGKIKNIFRAEENFNK